MAYGAAWRFRNLAVAAIFIGSAAGAHAEAVRLAALGDSLTQGYGLPPEDGLVPQLQAWLTARGADVTVLNAGVSGDTTAGGLSRTDWTLTPDVDAVMVALGGNDMLRGIDPAVSKANLAGILEKAAAKNLPVLLVPLSAPGNYGPEYKRDFDGMYPALATKYGALLAGDMFAPLMAARDAGTPMGDLMQSDGIHPSKAGVALIVEELGPDVMELLARVK
jgi:acyl-CoA thioesterase I